MQLFQIFDESDPKSNMAENRAIEGEAENQTKIFILFLGTDSLFYKSNLWKSTVSQIHINFSGFMMNPIQNLIWQKTGP